MRSRPRRMTNVSFSIRAPMPLRERCCSNSGLSPSRLRREEHDVAGRLVPHRVDERIVGVEHRVAFALHDRGDHALHVRELLDGVDAAQSEVVGGDVEHDADVASSKPSPARRMPPRAVSSTATSTVGFERMMLAENGPVMSPSITSRLPRYTPSVVVKPTTFSLYAEKMRDQPRRRRLAVRAGDGDDRDRRFAPGGYSMSMIGAPTFRGCPSVGCVCMRMPGPAFTSMITAPFSRNGTEMSGVSTSMPAMSRPTTPAAISHAVTLSGCISSVRSIDVPPVERFAVGAKDDEFALRRNRVERAAAGRRDVLGAVVRRQLRETLRVPDCRVADPGSPSRSAGARCCLPSPITCAGTRSAQRRPCR